MHDEVAFDPVLLRSFLAVAETLHFTAAARRRGIGQPTISQHVARLERSVGRPLLVRSTKTVTLTADGLAMVDLARDILDAQDRAAAWFERSDIHGHLRVGIGEDLALSRLPDLLRRFRSAHPGVELELTVGLSSELHASLNSNGFDLLFAKRDGRQPRGQVVFRQPLLWWGAEGAAIDPDRPVPLVLFPGNSITRRLAIEALNGARRSWRVAVASPSLVAMTAAVRAGYGITAQCPLVRAPGLVPVAAQDAELPPLPDVEFVVLARDDRPSRAAQALIESINAEAATIGETG
ncbi:LysR substrate-binding domain-containing protein [Rhizosaccharibacter radicis]|uniref:LysR substrate-binding domain-containing protein n=1 Tax=Rhizosaccharibacter radicis TaxID=2782605 RepID=A0ABT1W1W3_9PROT|nr:LysR substrate-binding domain-containing protein [Acetobacteraceae bacterium KSS12]